MFKTNEIILASQQTITESVRLCLIDLFPNAKQEYISIYLTRTTPTATLFVAYTLRQNLKRCRAFVSKNFVFLRSWPAVWQYK